MNIDVLLAGSNLSYMKRLSEGMKQKKLKTGDTLKVTMYTDEDKLRQFLSFRRAEGKKAKFHVALVDEDMPAGLLDDGDISVLLALTEDSDWNGGTYPFGHERTAVHIYKYQRITGITDKMLLELAKKRDAGKKGTASVCVFFSPSGGAGTSTAAAAYAVAAAQSGIKPLYVSMESFNAAEFFFSGADGAQGDLYDVFSVIKNGSGAAATVDAAKNTDKNTGVEFLSRFPVWTEIDSVTPENIVNFIDAARVSHGVGLVVLDLGSAFTRFVQKAFECADEIFVVSDGSRTSLIKMNVLMQDKTFFVSDCAEKLNVIYNNTAERGVLPGYPLAKSVTYMPNHECNSITALLRKLAAHMKELLPDGLN